MDSDFPFGAEPAEAASYDAPEPGRRPLPLVVGGVVAALALVGGGLLLLGGGEDEDLAPVKRAPRAAAPAEAEPLPVEALPVATTEVFGRNPFKVLYVAPAGGGGGKGEAGTPTETPKEVIEQSDPEFVPPQTAVVVVQQPSSPQQPGQQPAPQPAPAPVVEDDGVRYPIALRAIDVARDDAGEDRYVSWGWKQDGFEVLPGQPFGRFKHLRVMQVIDTAERQGVMLQMGDGSPYFVAVGETVYVL